MGVSTRLADAFIQVNQEIIHTELKDLVCTSVEEALNAMLDAEADKLVNAERYARNEERKGYRSGHYERSFTTTFGEINIKMPKLKGLTFETSIIERCFSCSFISHIIHCLTHGCHSLLIFFEIAHSFC